MTPWHPFLFAHLGMNDQFGWVVADADLVKWKAHIVSHHKVTIFF